MNTESMTDIEAVQRTLENLAKTVSEFREADMKNEHFPREYYNEEPFQALISQVHQRTKSDHNVYRWKTELKVYE